jgi:hypothetical protein
VNRRLKLPTLQQEISVDCSPLRISEGTIDEFTSAQNIEDIATITLENYKPVPDLPVDV